MDGFEFNVNEKIKMKFGIVGGSSPQPIPDPGADVIMGTPVLKANGAVLPISETIYGIAEEVE